MDHQSGLFPALLKHWRRQRGLSQLDLALAADVSSRHVSFLETARSTPSADMVLRLATALDIPLRHVNAMLLAAGHPAAYPEPDELDPRIRDALSLMAAHHDPYPLIVVDRLYRVRELNRGAEAVLTAVLGPDIADGSGPRNLARLTFDPGGAHPYIANFADVGRELLWRIQREVLADPDEGELRDLLDDLLAMPTVEREWRDVDLSAASDPALIVHLRRGDLDLRFLTTVTVFQAPQNVSVEGLRVESWFPADPATASACQRLVSPHRGDSGSG